MHTVYVLCPVKSYGVFFSTHSVPRIDSKYSAEYDEHSVAIEGK